MKSTTNQFILCMSNIIVTRIFYMLRLFQTTMSVYILRHKKENAPVLPFSHLCSMLIPVNLPLSFRITLLGNLLKIRVSRKQPCRLFLNVWMLMHEELRIYSYKNTKTYENHMHFLQKILQLQQSMFSRLMKVPDICQRDVWSNTSLEVTVSCLLDICGICCWNIP